MTTATGELIFRRRDSSWSTAVVASIIVHMILILALNQLPVSKRRLVQRDIVMTVDLLQPVPLEIPEAAPPEERGELAEPPPTNLLDMSAVALPEPGQDLYTDMPDPILDFTRDELTLPEPLFLPQEDRDLLSMDDKHSALSLSDDFSPTLPRDKIDAGTKSDALVLSETRTDRLAPIAEGPGHIRRKVGYSSSNPQEHTSSYDPSGLRTPGVSRSPAKPGKPTYAPPRPGSKSGRGRKRLRLEKPTVPSWVEEQGIEAFAKIRFQILENGKIGKVELAVSTSYRELDNLALSAVKRWLYEPGLMEYRSVKINFKLK